MDVFFLAQEFCSLRLRSSRLCTAEPRAVVIEKFDPGVDASRNACMLLLTTRLN